mmetsp:Transcript_27181/g.75991  ORF Transcript_27181/g.75991 Transcript_27181/m.75991 type:complete len:526 (-) Transcript_27181:286-1863(-)
MRDRPASLRQKLELCKNRSVVTPCSVADPRGDCAKVGGREENEVHVGILSQGEAAVEKVSHTRLLYATAEHVEVASHDDGIPQGAPLRTCFLPDEVDHVPGPGEARLPGAGPAIPAVHAPVRVEVPDAAARGLVRHLGPSGVTRAPLTSRLQVLVPRRPSGAGDLEKAAVDKGPLGTGEGGGRLVASALLNEPRVVALLHAEEGRAEIVPDVPQNALAGGPAIGAEGIPPKEVVGDDLDPLTRGRRVGRLRSGGADSTLCPVVGPTVALGHGGLAASERPVLHPARAPLGAQADAAAAGRRLAGRPALGHRGRVDRLPDLLALVGGQPGQLAPAAPRARWRWSGRQSQGRRWGRRRGRRRSRRGGRRASGRASGRRRRTLATRAVDGPALALGHGGLVAGESLPLQVAPAPLRAKASALAALLGLAGGPALVLRRRPRHANGLALVGGQAGELAPAAPRRARGSRRARGPARRARAEHVRRPRDLRVAPGLVQHAAALGGLLGSCRAHVLEALAVPVAAAPVRGR